MLIAECILALQNSLGNGVLGQCLVEMISIGGSTEVGTAPAAAADHCRCRERGPCARSGKVAATLLRPRSAAHCINRSFSTNLPGLAEPALFPFFQLAVAIATTGGC